MYAHNRIMIDMIANKTAMSIDFDVCEWNEMPLKPSKADSNICCTQRWDTQVINVAQQALAQLR